MTKRKKTSRTSRARISRSIADGHHDGYSSGYAQGYHLGRLHAVYTHTPTHPGKVWDVKVLYVASGKGAPYSPIDEAVCTALSTIVRECAVAPDPLGNVAELADQIQPDLVLVMDGLAFPVEQVEAIRAKGIRTAVWFTDDPYYTDITPPIAIHYDAVFTLESYCVPFYEALGCKNVHHLPLAANSQVFRPQHVEPAYRRDVCFIGTGFWNRIRFFDEIAPDLAQQNVLISGWWWDRLNHYPLLQNKINLGAWLSPEETSKFYSGSKITINMHRSPEDDSYNQNSRHIDAFSVNPRTFEIAACGTLQLTDERSDLVNRYIPGEEIVTYHSPADLVEKIRYYVTHEEERKQIALRGLARTLREHTYERRVHELIGAALQYQREEAVT